MPSSPVVRRAHHFRRFSRSFTLGTCLVILLGAMAPAWAQGGSVLIGHYPQAASPSSCVPDEALLQNWMTAHDEDVSFGVRGNVPNITMEQARKMFRVEGRGWDSSAGIVRQFKMEWEGMPELTNYDSIKALQAFIDRQAAKTVKFEAGVAASPPSQRVRYTIGYREWVAAFAVMKKMLECRIAELRGQPAQPPAGAKASAPSGANAAGAIAPASAPVGGPSSCTPDEALLQNFVTGYNDSPPKNPGFLGKATTMEEARQYFRLASAGSTRSIKELQASIDGDATYVRLFQGRSDPLHRKNVAEAALMNKMRECRIAELKAPAQPPAGSMASAPSGANAAGGSGATPGTGGSPAAKYEQAARQGRIIAGNGRSAMHCVSLVNVGRGSAAGGVSGATRVLSNGCEDKVEVTWCVGERCDKSYGGNTWTIHPGKSWPIEGTGEVRWAACHGANTVHWEKGSQQTRFYCNEPAKP